MVTRDIVFLVPLLSCSAAYSPPQEDLPGFEGIHSAIPRPEGSVLSLGWQLEIHRGRLTAVSTNSGPRYYSLCRYKDALWLFGWSASQDPKVQTALRLGEYLPLQMSLLDDLDGDSTRDIFISSGRPGIIAVGSETTPPAQRVFDNLIVSGETGDALFRLPGQDSIRRVWIAEENDAKKRLLVCLVGDSLFELSIDGTVLSTDPFEVDAIACLDATGDGNDDIVSINSVGITAFSRHGGKRSLLYTHEWQDLGVARDQYSLERVGDLDDDRIDDLFVFPTFAYKKDKGRLLLLSGSSGRIITRLSLDSIGSPVGVGTELFFPESVLGLDDIDDDGISDYVVSAASDVTGNGFFAVVSGKTHESLCFVEGMSSKFGSGFELADDVTGDGAGDLVVRSDLHRQLDTGWAHHVAFVYSLVELR